jgi:hypothetical protein
VARPVLCIIAQGSKCMMLGQEVYEYDASRILIFSVDLPVAGHVTRASRSEPYLKAGPRPTQDRRVGLEGVIRMVCLKSKRAAPSMSVRPTLE